jgi:hypothetical protein
LRLLRIVERQRDCAAAPSTNQRPGPQHVALLEVVRSGNVVSRLRPLSLSPDEAAPVVLSAQGRSAAVCSFNVLLE